MPLGRSSTGRSKSRSPLPPSTYQISLSPRPFLPPSHYAAAAGIPYRADKEANDAGDTYGDPNDHYTGLFMPVAYPSDAESTSDSSLDLKANSLNDEKPSTQSSAGQRGRRQSLINDLPQLEANLLPSLRDTIHRMTRSPSGPGSAQSQGYTSYLGVPAPSGHSSARFSRSASPSGASNRNFSETSHLEAHPTSNTAIHRSDLSTPERHSNESALATDPGTLTPRRTKLARPPTKGALKPPTPKLFSRASEHNSTSGAGSSTSVRSILKKTSINNLATCTDPEGGAKRRPTLNLGFKPNMTNARPRSRTDPGSPAMVSFADENSAPPSRTGHTAALGGKEPSRLQNSSIPRPQKRHLGPQTQWSADESDFENRFQAEDREHRQFVATAEVFPSSSESDFERREKASGSSGTALENNSRNARGEQRGLGLGLNLDSGMQKDRSSIALEKQATSSSYEDGSMRSSHRTRIPQKPARSSHLSHHFSTKTAKFDHDRDDVTDEYQRRREALLGIISRLESGKQSAQRAVESARAHSGEDDFAITVSRDFAGEAEQNFNGVSQQMHDDQLEHEDQSRRGKVATQIRRERPRSSSCTPKPTFLLPTKDDEEPTTGSSSYPRAALQAERYAGSSSIPSPKAERKRKPSRSPVIPQINTTALPAALRRHSVYHRPASPNLSPSKADRGTSDKRLASRRSSGAGLPRLQDRELNQQRDESSDVDSPPYAAAARERQACGIPPSDSVGADLSRRSLPHADSDLSSVGSVYWDDSDSELSPAAEKLFKNLGGSQAKGDRRSYQSVVDKPSRPGTNPRAPSPYPSIPVTDERSRHRQASPRRDERRPRFQLPSPPPPPPKDPPKQHDETEMRRQDLILEIYQAEEAFVNRLQVFVDLFVLPLRVQDSKNWIAGVPSEIARLFDWLEDIVVLHSQILSSLKAMRNAQHPAIGRIAESIRAFVPRLEVYQPYLVKLGDAVALVDQLVRDEHSDFGEFLRVQETSPDCEGWDIQHFLVEPINLLAKFPEYFSRLLMLTPNSHRDYMSTISLVHCTDMFIRVMTEVKAREDEYDLIQKFAARIQGLAPSAQLATRERRLLHQGILHLVDVEDNDPATASHSSGISRYFPPGSLDGANTAKRASKVATAMNQWDTGRGRSGSTSSSNAGLSLGCSSSGFSTGPPATPDSLCFPSFRILMPQGRPNQARMANGKMPQSPSPAPRNGSNAPALCLGPGMPVQVFVFTDLVLLAVPASTSNPGETDGWTLLKHIGTVRALDVQLEEQGSYGLHDDFPPLPVPNVPSVLAPGSTIKVEALTVDLDKLNQPTTPDDGSVFLLRFAVPNDIHGDDAAPPSSETKDSTTRSWMSAFRRSRKFTLVSLCTLSKKHDPQLDTALETQQTVLGLLASGLPMPKSPSVQIADMRARAGGADGDREGEGEREERGWWSLRFQQVFRELQRQDLALTLAGTADASSSLVDF
ncbi:hypothetical protein LshimejAT787_1202100 [Lyophyllum shimeji]|uniref:DH domain-containing protein n=1 Tax=Lyophyllum shimeji TaxID=47721 RepID=A0A9P3UU24_LYOSH|nr:hypothetical protein LshimejAT787_1202100 [Lyophyllum shimeji]